MTTRKASRVDEVSEAIDREVEAQKALAEVMAALEPLTRDQQRRVIDAVAVFFGVDVSKKGCG